MADDIWRGPWWKDRQWALGAPASPGGACCTYTSPKYWRAGPGPLPSPAHTVFVGWLSDRWVIWGINSESRVFPPCPGSPHNHCKTLGDFFPPCTVWSTVLEGGLWPGSAGTRAFPSESCRLCWRWWFGLRAAAFAHERWQFLLGLFPPLSPQLPSGATVSSGVTACWASSPWVSPGLPDRASPHAHRETFGFCIRISICGIRARESKGSPDKTAWIKFCSRFNVELQWTWNANCRSWSWMGGVGEEPFGFVWGDGFM